MLKDSNLVFIISQPRSGSTLLQKILSNASEISTASEPWILLPFLGYDQPQVVKGIYHAPTARVAFRDLENTGNNQFLIRDYVKEMIFKIYERLKGEDARYFIDKTPRYYEILPLIREWFPESKIIILKRNPFAVFSSIVHTWKKFSLFEMLEYKRDIINAPFLIQKFVENEEHHVKVLHYESFITNTQREIKNVFDWLEIPYREEYLNFSENDKLRGSLGDSKVNDFRKVDSSNIEKWNQKRSNKNIASFLNGYSRFLTPEFLEKYGGYKEINEKDTEVFDYFLYLTKYYHSRFPEHKILRYYIHKIKKGDIRKPIFR
jgi:hypothetical protein